MILNVKHDTAARARRKGFTLLEASIAIVVLSVLLGIALTALQPNNNERLRACADLLAADLRLAQSLAMRDATDMTLSLTDTGWKIEHTGGGAAPVLPVPLIGGTAMGYQIDATSIVGTSLRESLSVDADEGDCAKRHLHCDRSHASGRKLGILADHRDRRLSGFHVPDGGALLRSSDRRKHHWRIAAELDHRHTRRFPASNPPPTSTCFARFDLRYRVICRSAFTSMAMRSSLRKWDCRAMVGRPCWQRQLASSRQIPTT